MDNNIITLMREEFAANADPAIAESSKRFFKEEIKLYGMKSATANKIIKKYFKEIKNNPKENVFSACGELWGSGFHEEAIAACEWAYGFRKQFVPEDFATFGTWVDNHVSNWAMCDTFCNHTIGDFVMMYPEFVNELKRWAKSGNRWTKRAAAVSLIVPARKGLFLSDIFEIADILLTDEDDLVQKGYGWMLKAASEAYPKEVFDYVVSKKETMPRTAFRYALEKMPEEMRAEAMKKQ